MGRLSFEASQSGSRVYTLDSYVMLPLTSHVPSRETGHLHLCGAQADPVHWW